MDHSIISVEYSLDNESHTVYLLLTSWCSCRWLLKPLVLGENMSECGPTSHWAVLIMIIPNCDTKLSSWNHYANKFKTIKAIQVPFITTVNIFFFFLETSSLDFFAKFHSNVKKSWLDQLDPGLEHSRNLSLQKGVLLYKTVPISLENVTSMYKILIQV